MKAVLFSPSPSLPFCISQAEEEKLLLTEAAKGCEMHSAYSSQLRKQAKTRTFRLNLRYFEPCKPLRLPLGKAGRTKGKIHFLTREDVFVRWCVRAYGRRKEEKRGRSRKNFSFLLRFTWRRRRRSNEASRSSKDDFLPSYSFPCQPGSYAEKERGWVGFAIKIGRPKNRRAS